MIIEKLENGLYKAKIDKNIGDYEIGDTIWNQFYCKNEMRYIRKPAYNIVKVRETKNNLILTLKAI